MRVMTNLRAFAAQREPQSLFEMQETYHGFTSDERSLEIAGVVRSALSKAWDGIGAWRGKPRGRCTVDGGPVRLH
jgi:hypothetical protein